MPQDAAFDAPLPRHRAWLSLGVVAVSIAVDVTLFRFYWRGLLDDTTVSTLRVANGAGAMAIVSVLLRRSRVDMGLRFESDIPWRLVLKWGIRGAGAFVALFAVWVGAFAQLRGACALRVIPSFGVEYILSGALVAPLVEEPLYRGALCPAAHSVLGRRGGIVVSGAVFGGLHVIYGNAGIANLTAGFLFGWLFYWSRSLLVPSLVHGAGNGLLFGLQYLTRWFYEVDATTCGVS